ncbi:DNA-binding transcriptional regulator, AcrR family [Amycolatopsis pretoriensis]|uniref:DNA-binding transcriptional regulator, AcrR family n=1 Tax=Amycolatopsis pretoriensis TaxID=218821 RepID=A0A1H5Q778_9PSEU|nr:TetR/AcrR family transcriptional regulator [Amycolatopsis pretoriensis]SEF21744.1 DNA-binding transcriptional regulator, AcrR family [Amycolatopsis pretoriensis]
MATKTAADTRERILEAAAALLVAEGRDGLSTRAVSAAAGVQPPALYRLFGDKDGLLDAVAAYGFDEYLTSKRALGSTGDAVEDLRRGWDLHIEFGLSRPEFYVLMYGDARPGRTSPAAREAEAMLRGIVERVATAGRLRVSVERAARLVHATGMGVVLSLIATPEQERDEELSPTARETVMARILTGTEESPGSGLPERAIALRAGLDGAEALTQAERVLMAEWLDRIANA